MFLICPMNPWMTSWIEIEALLIWKLKCQLRVLICVWIFQLQWVHDIVGWAWTSACMCRTWCDCMSTHAGYRISQKEGYCLVPMICNGLSIGNLAMAFLHFVCHAINYLHCNACLILHVLQLTAYILSMSLNWTKVVCYMVVLSRVHINQGYMILAVQGWRCSRAFWPMTSIQYTYIGDN